MKKQLYSSPLTEVFTVRTERNLCDSMSTASTGGIEALGNIDYESDWE